MEHILNRANVRIKEPAESWEDAIRRAGQVLVDAGSITNGYIEAMIDSVRSMGPYIVIMPGFALAHAAPSANVMKSDLGLITLESPVTFGSPNDPVSVVLCLACTDSSSHMDKLSKVAEILMSENKIEQLKDAADTESIVKLFEMRHEKKGEASND